MSSTSSSPAASAPSRFQIQELNPAVSAEISYLHSFRVITDKKSPNFGKTRPSVEISFSIPKFDDLPARETFVLLQYAIRMLTLEKFKENSADWNFVPSAADLSISSLAASLLEERKSGSRLWKVANIRIFFDVFSPVFSAAGKSAGFIQTFQKLAELKFVPLAGKDEKISPLLDFLNSSPAILEFLESSEFAENENSEIAAGIFSEIISILESLKSADSLDLSNLD